MFEHGVHTPYPLLHTLTLTLTLPPFYPPAMGVAISRLSPGSISVES